jgi:hypothetical protein
VVLSVLLTFLGARSAQADEFSKVTYDGQQDELVITMRYLTPVNESGRLHWARPRCSGIAEGTCACAAHKHSGGIVLMRVQLI